MELLKANVNVYQSLRPFHPMQPLLLQIRVGEMGCWWDYVRDLQLRVLNAVPQPLERFWELTKLGSN